MALTQTPQIITDLDADCGIIVDFDGNLLSVAPQCVRRRIVDGVWGEDYSDFAIDNASLFGRRAHRRNGGDIGTELIAPKFAIKSPKDFVVGFCRLGRGNALGFDALTACVDDFEACRLAFPLR